MWPVSASLTTRLYGCKQELEKTTSFVSLAALIVYTANAKKKKDSNHDLPTCGWRNVTTGSFRQNICYSTAK